MISKRTLLNLEYDKLLAILSNYASSPIAKQKILSMQPSSDINVVNASLARTKEGDKINYDLLSKPYFGIDDITETLLSSAKNSTLSLA